MVIIWSPVTGSEIVHFGSRSGSSPIFSQNMAISFEMFQKVSKFLIILVHAKIVKIYELRVLNPFVSSRKHTFLTLYLENCAKVNHSPWHLWVKSLLYCFYFSSICQLFFIKRRHFLLPKTAYKYQVQFEAIWLLGVCWKM